MTQLTLEIKRLSPDAKLPTKAHADDSGLDIYATEDIIVEPGETVVVKTGLSIKLPPGHDAYIKPRSGVSTKTKLRVVSPPIDVGYRGEIGVIVDNISAPEYEVSAEGIYLSLQKAEVGYYLTLDGSEKDLFHTFYTGTYKIRKGDRIAQLVVTPVALPQIVEVDDLDETERGDSGYGASGVR